MARIFISHSSRDNSEAGDLFAWLKSRGFEHGFLDIDKHLGIPPGERWEQRLYDELERAQAVILLLTTNWFDSKWCFAEFAQARSRGKAIFPLIASPDGDQFVGDDLQKLDLTRDRESGLEQLASRLTEVALLSQGGFDFPPGRAPYPGFLAFDEDDAAVYFGRDDDVRRLIQRLDSRRIEGGRRFVLLLGESGTGKSSLIKAGLIPRLRRARRDWIVLAPFRPETDPFEGFALSLAEAGFRIAANELAEVDPKAMAAALAGAHDAFRAGILVPIDQMEELFTRTSSELRQRFLAFLSRLLAPGLPFVAMATLRSDHLGEMQTAEGLTAEFEDFSLRPMSVERIGEIVRGPARIAGLDVDEGLAARIAGDAKSADALPLVAFALRRLYDQFGGNNRIQLVEYESLRDTESGLSPLETIVRDTAARVIAEEKPSEAELKALREAFVPGLVRINDEGGFVRQAARWDDLPEAGRRLAMALAGPQARLLVIREHEGIRQVEVAHEALFRVWPLLAGWLEEEEDFLIGRNRLERALADWQALPEPDRAKGLIAGILLDRARTWLVEHAERFSEEEATFIHASEAAETERQRLAEEQRRALETARLRQAETERDAARRLTRRTRVAAAFLGLVALVAAGAGVYAMRAQNEAEKQATIAGQQRTKAEKEADRAEKRLELVRNASKEIALASPNFDVMLESYRRLVDIDRDDEAWQSALYDNLEYFGDNALSGEELSRALAAFGEALAIARRFSPKDNEWLRRQATLLEKTGAIMSQSGNKTEAAGRFEESLAIRRKLVESEPDNLQWQIDLAFGLRTAANATGDFDESLRRLGEARDIIERLDSEGRLSAGQESWLTSIQSEMSRIDAARLVAPARK